MFFRLLVSNGLKFVSDRHPPISRHPAATVLKPLVLLRAEKPVLTLQSAKRLNNPPILGIKPPPSHTASRAPLGTIFATIPIARICMIPLLGTLSSNSQGGVSSTALSRVFIFLRPLKCALGKDSTLCYVYFRIGGFSDMRARRSRAPFRRGRRLHFPKHGGL